MKLFYKIVCSIFAFAIFPVALFLPFIRITLDSTLASVIKNVLGISIPSKMSLYDFYNTISDFSDQETINLSLSSILDNDAIEPLKTPFIMFATFLLLALVFAVVVIVFALFTKKKMLATVFSALGLISTFAMKLAFTEFATPFLNGTVSIASILDISLLSFLGTINYLALSSAYSVMIVLFLSLIAINIGFKVTEIQNQ